MRFVHTQPISTDGAEQFCSLCLQEERYLPAKVLTNFAKGEPTTVLTEDGEKRKLNAAQSNWACDCNVEALNSGIEDLINISDLNEMSILHNLRIRFKEDKIYTNISSILISVNPFKMLPLYTPEMLDKYRTGYRSKGLAPHIFGVAYNSFTAMLADSRDQSVVISGESGAGKSEATKLILQFLTDVSSRSGQSGGGASSTLEQQILAANPILEAFGNAKTLRNNNSSRFGKLITVNFDSTGSIIGGGIINYLLEKSRVVTQTKGERNYHIFYQLLSAADTDPILTERLHLQNPELFNFTGQSGVISIDGVSDEKDFEDMKRSMDILRFSEIEKNEVFDIVAGVLHFGNVKFAPEKKSGQDDGSTVVNMEVLNLASKLWKIDPANIAKYLCTRNIGSREVILVDYNIYQAQDAKDAMVKRVYAELFQIVVNKINAELDTGHARKQNQHKFIGVLDIFGFESFQVTSQR
jgi:myosin-7